MENNGKIPKRIEPDRCRKQLTFNLLMNFMCLTVKKCLKLFNGILIYWIAIIIVEIL